MGAFGEKLRQARIDRHGSISDAERETRIHRRYLEALENEDFNALPAPVYTSGFIRTYAGYLGLDPESCVDLFQPRRGRDDPPEIRPATSRIVTPKPISLRLVGAASGVVLAIALVGYLWSQYNAFVESIGQVAAQGPSRTTVPVTPSLARPRTALPASSPVVVAVASPTVAPTPVRGVRVEARVTERTWLAVWVDSRPVMAEEVQPGFARAFDADESIRMRVGNAAGVHVTVNGTSQGALGARGQIIDA